MQGVPTFLAGNHVVIAKTPNGGFAVCEDKNDPSNRCPAFQSWDELVLYLKQNFAQVV